MESLRQHLEDRPFLARALPFVLVVLLTALQGEFGAASAFWIYGLKTLVGAALLWLVWPLVPEMRWRFGFDAIAVGAGIAVVWVGVSHGWATQDGLWGSGADPAALDGAGWNPLRHFAGAPMLAWTFVAVRFLGSGLVVPPLEEAFYRSLVYRSLAGTDFLAVSLRLFAWRPFALTALVFGFAHEQWLAGIVCGAAYQWLVLRHGRLGEAMTAHAVTNVLLGVWVVAAGDWRFW